MNHLAVQRSLSASSQTQALNAIVFLYRDVLVLPLGEMNGLNRVQQRKRIPVVMTAKEVSAVLSQMSGSTLLMAQLMYGSGLRVEECCTLRVKDIDFGSSVVNVRNGKGAKDRTTVLPICLQPGLQAHLIRIAQLQPMTEIVARVSRPYQMRLSANTQMHLSLSHGSSCFLLPCVDLGGKVGVLPVGMYRPRRSNAHSVRLWFARGL